MTDSTMTANPEEGGEIAANKGPDNRWLDFSTTLQPLWERLMPPEPSGAQLRTKDGAIIVVLTFIGQNVVVRVPRQEIETWSFTQFDENRDGTAAVATVRWAPNYDGIQIASDKTPCGMVTKYKYLSEAIVSCTDAMAVQFSKARLMGANYVSAQRHMWMKPIPADHAASDRLDGVFHVNQELWDQEMAGQLGRFLLSWQWLELNIRTLMITLDANGKRIADIYTPNRIALNTRVETTLRRIDESLCTEIKQVIQHRNNIIHGALVSRGHVGDPHIEAEIVHHDLVATAHVGINKEPSKEGRLMVPKNSGIYASKRIAQLTHITRQLTARIVDVIHDDTKLELHRRSKRAPSGQRRRGTRARAKRN